RGRDRYRELLPCRPGGRDAWHQQQRGEPKPETRAVLGPPRKPQQDQHIEGGVLEEVDGVGKERYRPDRHRHRELDAEVQKVERGDPGDDTAQRVLRAGEHGHGYREPAARTRPRMVASMSRHSRNLRSSATGPCPGMMRKLIPFTSITMHPDARRTPPRSGDVVRPGSQ